jgi:chorismate mutase/prephenate dehydratase
MINNRETKKSIAMKENNSESRIQALRSSIDKIDGEILERINRRLHLARDIGEIKNTRKERIIDPDRESEVVYRLGELNKGPLGESSLRRIFSEIIAASREIQKSGSRCDFH